MRFKEPIEDKESRLVIPNPGVFRPQHPLADRHITGAN